MTRCSKKPNVTHPQITCFHTSCREELPSHRMQCSLQTDHLSGSQKTTSLTTVQRYHITKSCCGTKQVWVELILGRHKLLSRLHLWDQPLHFWLHFFSLWIQIWTHSHTIFQNSRHITGTEEENFTISVTPWKGEQGNQGISCSCSTRQ